MTASDPGASACVTIGPHATPAELRELGRAARKLVGRSSHGTWRAPKDRPDPVAVLAASNERRVPTLAPIRIGRMMADPFAFLRGSAVVMDGDLATTASTGLHVQICGDMHLLNFGVFATPERNLVFDINDFDETLPGPWEWDLKRLATSFEVAARVTGMSAETGSEAVLALAATYRRWVGQLATMTTLDRWYTEVGTDEIVQVLDAASRASEGSGTGLGADGIGRVGAVASDALTVVQRTVHKARRRTSLRAFAKLTTVVDGQPRINDDPPILERIVDEEHRERLHGLLVQYRETLDEAHRHLYDEFEVVDFGRKVVGVGSVGTRAYIALLIGPNGGPLFLQMKEAQPSVLEAYVGPSEHRNAGKRVVRGQQLMQGASDVLLGWGRAEDTDFYVRQLLDMKGSVDLATLPADVLPAYAALCGRTLARAHARSAHPAAIAEYLGPNDRFDHALAKFATAYAEQVEADHAALVQAVRLGRIPAIQGV